MSTTAEPPSRRAYQPALDGLRGLSVSLVLVFHGGFSWMTGGYVGVSVFFTLSGFLITGLLIAERDATGRISASRFYGRRLKRLMPASLLCLSGVAVAAAFGEFGGLPHVRRDIFAALFEVANWAALANGTSYADLINGGQLGPVDHFWSLSIEEQFYWVWPLVCGLLLARVVTARSRRTAFVAIAVLGIVTAPVVASVWGPDAAYWATPARLGEILVGAALAALLSGRTFSPRRPAWVGAAGFAGLAVVLFAAIAWPDDGGPAYHGWLGVFALASGAVILGLQVPGPLRSLFSVGALVYLGRISYGVYLFHWPLFAVLTEQRTGLDGWALFGVRIAATMAVAIASFHLLEQPIRHGRSPARKVAYSTAGAVAAVAVLVLLVVPAPTPVFSGETDVPATFAPPTPTSTPATAAAPTVAPSTTTTAGAEPGVAGTTTVPPSSTTPPPTGPVHALLLGDSTMVALGEGMFDWAEAHPDLMQVASLAEVGCGFVRDSAMAGDDDGKFRTRCDQALDQELPALLASQVPEVAVVMITVPDVVGRVFDADQGQLTPSDPVYRERLRRDYAAMADQLLGAGVRHVVWLVPPFPNKNWPRYSFDPIHPEDWQTYLDTIRATADAHPDAITVLAFDQWMATEGDDLAMRPDGLHLQPDAARDAADRYVAPMVLEVARG